MPTPRARQRTSSHYGLGSNDDNPRTLTSRDAGKVRKVSHCLQLQQSCRCGSWRLAESPQYYSLIHSRSLDLSQPMKEVADVADLCNQASI
jgi:hypothetical protein